MALAAETLAVAVASFDVLGERGIAFFGPDIFARCGVGMIHDEILRT
jgi:hypothetical protein